MEKQNVRLIFLFALFFVGMFLFNAWQIEREDRAPAPTSSVSTPSNGLPGTQDLPTPIAGNRAPSVEVAGKQAAVEQPVDAKNIIHVSTDVYNLQIDAVGGDIIYLNLPKYPESLEEQNQGFVLLDESSDRFYVVQSGLLNEQGPDSNAKGRAQYKFASNKIRMDDDESVLNVDLNYTTPNNVKITKRFVFQRGSYVILVHYLIDNQSGQNYEANVFGRIKRNAPNTESSGMFGTMRTYTGAAINTPEVKYKKLPFADMQKKPFKEDVKGGWTAMVEHYFATALIPSSEEHNYYQTETFPNNIFGVRFIGEAQIIAPGTQKLIETKVYAGPEIAENLKAVAPGLDLTIDYGVLWFLCQPIFWLLKTMFEVFGNWGVAIIFTTVIIKLLFYKLSASSYKSMGNMRKLQPKIEALKQRFGEDKTQFSQAMMALYKKEKINPLGGCLPILVQIPVFIALYYVLLESVELRQAPFALWIHDLSAKDPYYVLPIIMGISMVVQQRLNPTPPDPIQAKVMMFMPVLFTFLFLQFPAGLVLYWVVNNLLSILQQWMITRKIEKAAK